MKSISSIQSEKQKLIDRRDELYCRTEITTQESRELKSARRKIVFLNTCEYYLESEPSMEYINSEIESLTNKVSILNERIGGVLWDKAAGKISKEESESRISEIQKPYKVTHLMKQIKTLRYLLK